MQIFVKDCPMRSAGGAFPTDFAEVDGGAQHMPNTIHPSPLPAFEMRIDDGNPFVYLLQCKSMVLRGKYGLSDECGIRMMGPLIRVGAWRELVGRRFGLVLGKFIDWPRGRDYVDQPRRRGGSRR